MARFKLTIEYHGGPFAGWQRQDNAVTVQGVLEDAVEAFCQDRVTVHGAGRTDSGVHALGQAAHLDLAREVDAFRLQEALNHHVRPHKVAVLRAQEVGDGFHARFSAVRRRYLYRILDRRPAAALAAGLVWKPPSPEGGLDVGAMRAAAARLVGQHDFTTFRDAQCQADSPVKTLDRLDVAREAGEVRIRAEARSFLHRQVRSMVGSLVEVGLGRWSPEDLEQALRSCDRSACGRVAPPDGLYLTSVVYPPGAEGASSHEVSSQISA